MKKIYLSAIALSIATLSFGQHVKSLESNSFGKIASDAKAKMSNNPTNGNKALLWSNDFSNIADWSITNTSPNGEDWQYTTTIDAIPNLNPDTVLHATGANGYIYIDSDNLGGTSTQNVTATIVAPIDLTGQPFVTLSWSQHYMSYAEVFTVSVSNDNGLTYTDFIIDNGPSVSPQIQEFGIKSLNISAVAGGASQVKVKFNYQGAWDWWWSIDDVAINTAESNELGLLDSYYGTAAYPYSRIPVAQIQPIQVSAFVANTGAVDQTNTVLEADINTGLFNIATAPQTVASGATDSMGVLWTPPVTTGVPYIITVSAASDSTDATPANNTFTFDPIEITDNIYAYDDYGTPGAGGGLNGTDASYEAGNNFDIFVAVDLVAIDVVIGAGTPVGTNFKGVLYQRLAAAPFFQKITETVYYQSTTGMIDNVTSLLLPAVTPLLPNETYFVGISSLSELYYGTSGTSPGGSGTAAQTSLIFYGTMDAPLANKNFYTTSTPMVRMNFDPALVGVEEVNQSIKFNVFPNPSNGVFNINISSKENNNVNLTVKNLVGQTIISKTVNVSGQTKEIVSLSDYSKGIYFLTVDNKTAKLIVE